MKTNSINFQYTKTLFKNFPKQEPTSRLKDAEFNFLSLRQNIIKRMEIIFANNIELKWRKIFFIILVRIWFQKIEKNAVVLWTSVYLKFWKRPQYLLVSHFQKLNILLCNFSWICERICDKNSWGKFNVEQIIKKTLARFSRVSWEQKLWTNQNHSLHQLIKILLFLVGFSHTVDDYLVFQSEQQDQLQLSAFHKLSLLFYRTWFWIWILQKSKSTPE